MPPIYSKNPTFTISDQLSPLWEIALPLVTSRGGQEFFASGTATVIAPRLALTARHVVEDFWQKYESDDVSHRNATGTFNLQAIQILSKDAGHVWEIRKFWASPHSDIALLELSSRSKQSAAHRWKTPRLSLFPPPAGSRIAGFGYHTHHITADRSGNSVSVHLRHDPCTTVGEVEEVHDRMRDRVKLPFPCFRTNARFDGGMSGGPIFNDDGHLCGFICASTDGNCYSYGSTLWPVLSTVIDLRRPDLAEGTKYPAYDLVKLGVVSVIGLEKLILERNEGGAVERIGISLP
jgi:hypothetical protein